MHPQPLQKPPHSSRRNIWAPSTCVRGPGSVPAPWQRDAGSEILGSNEWRETSSPGPAGASPPQSPRLTATRCRGREKRSRSWRKEGARVRVWRSRTGCTLRGSRIRRGGAQRSAWRSRRARKCWSRTLTACVKVGREPGYPCGGCRLDQSRRAWWSGPSPQISLVK